MGYDQYFLNKHFNQLRHRYEKMQWNMNDFDHFYEAKYKQNHQYFLGPTGQEWSKTTGKCVMEEVRILYSAEEHADILQPVDS